MADLNIISLISSRFGIRPLSVNVNCLEEIYVEVDPKEFKPACLAFHKALKSPVAAFFALDNRHRDRAFHIFCVFESARHKKWIFVTMKMPSESPRFESIAREIYSANLFEREIKEMFGMEPEGNPDIRSLRLHDEVWPEGLYPLRKDFKKGMTGGKPRPDYRFARVEGEGVFEVPVGPVHAGIIGPGHFRFSVAGEPIINLEARLGFTHKGIEKLFEDKEVNDGVKISECVSGDSAFAHSLAFCRAVEKICDVEPPREASILRGILLELERMYNHINDIGGIALDVGFSFPSMYCAIIKEAILELNSGLTGSRYLKGVNAIGNMCLVRDLRKKETLKSPLESIVNDFKKITGILNNSVSFMDRVDGTGILKKKTAEDLGVVGLAARAAGIPADLRKDFPGIYREVRFAVATQSAGDALSRLRVRQTEFEESVSLIGQFVDKLLMVHGGQPAAYAVKPGSALGYAEGWRGPVLYWVKINSSGRIERCKIVDPSFHNWQGLCFSVLGDIVPDFPLCNKSFDLSYSGNDL